MGKFGVSVILLLLPIFFAGCEANGHQFRSVTLKDNEAVIYIYRGNPYGGSAVTLNIDVDKQRIGELKNNGYLYKVVPVGEHAVSSTTETTEGVTIDAKASKSYYVEAEVVVGFWVGRPKLTLVPEETGKAAVGGKKYSSEAEPSPEK